MSKRSPSRSRLGSSTPTQKKYKVVFAGDSVGKSSFLDTMFSDKKGQPTEEKVVYEEKDYKIFHRSGLYKGKKLGLEVFEAPEGHWDSLLEVVPRVDIFVLAFDVAKPITFQRAVQAKAKIEDAMAMYDERGHQKGTPAKSATRPQIKIPFILLGMKVDLRDDEEFHEKMQKKAIEVGIRYKMVNSSKALKIAKQYGFSAYREVSALTGEGLHDAVRTITREAHIHHWEEESKDWKCAVM
ncbi:hypothetical protein AAMO2058_000304700 [Amorphochlora amoebiformis]